MKNKTTDFDVIIVGGGHAGIEAAYSSAKMGSKVLLITLDLNKIGLMRCNPAIGGIGKGHIVYEISALGGLMPKLCTQTYLQARMLNTSKGPAVQGLRLQIDKYAYNTLSKKMLEQLDNLTLYEGTVDDIILDAKKQVSGVRTANGSVFNAQSVVLTTGTFLNGKMHIGNKTFIGGGRGEDAVTALAFFLQKLGLKMGRLKTGTPPRLLASSVDFSKMECQQPDNLNYLFEFYPHKSEQKRACYITHTNEKTHEVIKKNLHLSAMYNGTISGVGPRYCPSIEDKIGRFPDKQSHLVFVEPEGENAHELYPNGISTSLPLEVQKEYIRTIKGFEDAIITKPGYAVEYDFVLPDQLHHTLEVKVCPGLYLAGQINGTTGYEEAAGQGIIAGINAHCKTHNAQPFILDRNESYIGVMIDDLVTMGVDEPYRMFTSRAERRLTLRQDNVFLRLTDKAYNLGLIDQELYNDFQKEKELVQQTLQELRSGNKHVELLRLFGESQCNATKIKDITGKQLDDRPALMIQATIMYAPYLDREQREIDRAKQHAQMKITPNFDFCSISGLSKELQQKLNKYKPHNIDQASRIPGMTPAAISLLIIRLRKKNSSRNKTSGTPFARPV